jgi:hypothetical protein
MRRRLNRAVRVIDQNTFLKFRKLFMAITLDRWRYLAPVIFSVYSGDIKLSGWGFDMALTK